MSELFSIIEKNAGDAEPFGAIINLDTGEDGIICIDGTGDKILVTKEKKDARTTIELSSHTLERLLSHRLNPTMAAMSGKLKIRGDMALALKLAAVL